MGFVKEPIAREEVFVAHSNALLTPLGRLAMVRRVVVRKQKIGRVARDVGVSRQTVRKWVRRYLEEGKTGLRDRSSRPHRSPGQVSPAVERLVLDTRRWLRAGPARIAAATGVAERTVTRILRRNGVPLLRDCDPLTGEPKQRVVRGLGIRYERSRPGELLHMDVKKLATIPPGGGWPVHGRENVTRQGVGWTFVHSVVDDHTRLAYSEALPDEKAPTFVGFTIRALQFYREYGITHIQELMTDNHPGYTHNLRFKAL